MTQAPQPDPDIAARFHVRDATFVEQTGIATIWKVRSDEHGVAALKIYQKPDMGNERPGFDLLAALDGASVTKVYGVSDNAALMEWLEGPSLGDMTRAGHDRDASAHLVAVAKDIHAHTRTMPAMGLPRLETWFQALFDLRAAPELAKRDKDNLLICKDIARGLLGSQTDIRPLHGDLHHDNIKHGSRGYCAFDAKGVLGERTYELANAFRNPKGVPDLVRSPARLLFLADLWSDAFDVDRDRLLRWAVAKCGLSIAWRSGPDLVADGELEVLAMFVRAALPLGISGR